MYPRRRGEDMKKILIANRGEIASRIIQTCEAMGIKTVAVYSDADVNMPFVQQANEAYRIGEAQVNQSYLKMDAIIEVAKKTDVDAIHPGYGLLSENSSFAKKVKEAGIQFIGPSPETIEQMGDKVKARAMMKAAGVPVVPGSDQAVANVEEAIRLANQIGFPVMLKASGGGGGIGMVRCENEQALDQHFMATKNRAKAYFGSTDVFLEKCIDNARHVEVQIFGDESGQVVHLFERNCSVQRRNQKVIEEAVSPHLSNETQEAMYEAAIKGAKAVSYKNAGTMEFLVDEQEKFYFLEMNTRLQVEHPVTEAITGIDLVNWQILVAQGKTLPLTQSDIKRNGHAIECRIYAEDPNTFYPSPGTISTLQWGESDHVRIDSGYMTESTVTPFYDPMIAKVIIFAENRDTCIAETEKFLETTRIEGIKTNIPYLLKIINTQSFQAGNYTTNIISQYDKVGK